MEHRPYTLIAELTYKCPLRCVYCSNPIDLHKHANTLDTRKWIEVIEAAARLGALQIHFTGGEPLLRKDLEELVHAARRSELYVNLITSGVPLTHERLRGLASAGLDNVQLSIQDIDHEGAAKIAGVDYLDHKLEVASWVRVLDLPLTINVVLHRWNLPRVERIIALAEELGADRLELANVQYQSWAFENRDQLMPTAEQLDAAWRIASEAKERLAGRMEVVFVKPDYFGTYPRACMDGWARRFIVVSPAGYVLPCHAAHAITTLKFDSVRDQALETIWDSSPALLAFRGEDWMHEPCRSCERRDVDFGGCRCQAFQLTGDAAAPDPACSLTPAHALVRAARQTSTEPRPLRYRSR